MTGKSTDFKTVDRIGGFRESFVTNLVARFPNHFDLQEVLGIVENLKAQSLAVDTTGIDMYSRLSH